MDAMKHVADPVWQGPRHIKNSNHLIQIESPGGTTGMTPSLKSGDMFAVRGFFEFLKRTLTERE